MANTPSGKNKVVNIGTSLVLVVFIILTLVTFAALSAVAASGDYQASAAAAHRVTAYYKAAAQAEEKLAEINCILQASYANNPAAYPANSFAALEALGLAVTPGTPPLLSYNTPVSETQVLFVQLALHAPSAASPTLYTRKAWQERAQTPWQDNATLPLL